MRFEIEYVTANGDRHTKSFRCERAYEEWQEANPAVIILTDEFGRELEMSL